MNGLRAQLEGLASNFVSGILAAMHSASLADLTDGGSPTSNSTAPKRRLRTLEAPIAPTGPSRNSHSGGGRRKRASAAEIEQQKAMALSTAKGLKPGFSKGDIMRKSGSSVDLGRALTLLVADGKLTKKGDRRLTRYSVK